MSGVPRSLARRVPAALAAVLTVAAGLGLRAVSDGPIGDVGGVVLYAVLIHLLVLLARPGTTPTRAAVVALAVCWAVEFLQLTPWPAAASRSSTLARLVLGSTFDAKDLAAYAAGVLLVLGAHIAVISRRRRT